MNHRAFKAHVQAPPLGLQKGARFTVQSIGLLLAFFLLSAPTRSAPPGTPPQIAGPVDISSLNAMQRGTPLWLPPALAAELPPSFINSRDGAVTRAVNGDPDLVDALIALAETGPYFELVTIEFQDHTAGQFRVFVNPGQGPKPTSIKLAWSGVAFKRVNGVEVRIVRNGDPLFMGSG